MKSVNRFMQQIEEEAQRVHDSQRRREMREQLLLDRLESIASAVVGLAVILFWCTVGLCIVLWAVS